MASMSLAAATGNRYELWFASLHREGRALAFPCDEAGQVDCDDLSDRARDNYFYARSTVGRDYAAPSVIRVAAHGCA
jgi:hypothetical protein